MTSRRGVSDSQPSYWPIGDCDYVWYIHSSAQQRFIRLVTLYPGDARNQSRIDTTSVGKCRDEEGDANDRREER